MWPTLSYWGHLEREWSDEKHFLSVLLPLYHSAFQRNKISLRNKCQFGRIILADNTGSSLKLEVLHFKWGKSEMSHEFLHLFSVVYKKGQGRQNIWASEEVRMEEERKLESIASREKVWIDRTCYNCIAFDSVKVKIETQNYDWLELWAQELYK